MLDREGYEILRMDQEPSDPRNTDKKWKLVPLYKENEAGSLMFREIGFEGLSSRILFIEHGFVESEKKQREEKVIELKKSEQFEKEVNKEKENEEILKQALLEGKRDFQKTYLKKNYRPGGEAPTQMNLMRGLKWEPEKTEIAIPFGVMPKLDGFRFGAKLDFSGKVVIRSSNNVLYDHLDHIREQLAPLFAFLPPNAEVDGEIYNAQFTLYEINSIVRSSKEKHPDNCKMNAYMFDLIYQSADPYEKRYQILKDAISTYRKMSLQDETSIVLKNIFLLPLFICHDVADIDRFFKYFNEQLGYEGAIIRCLSTGAKTPQDIKRSMYQSGKCNHFYKIKLFDDEEGTVIGMEDCKGKYSGCARWILKDPRGNLVKVLHHGPVKEKQAAFMQYKANPKDFLGRLYKYRFQSVEEENSTVARHPVGLSFRDIDQV